MIKSRDIVRGNRIALDEVANAEKIRKLQEEVDSLRSEIEEVRTHAEEHAFSVRQLIGQRARLLELIELIGKKSKFDSGRSVEPVAKQIRNTDSQFYQDIFGLLLSNGKRDGFFVEFGGCDGLKISNTILLERDFGWSGIVAEPSMEWHKELKINRKCIIDTRSVWSESGKKIEFYLQEDNALQSSAFADHMGIKRSKAYEVETVSLVDLLRQHEAPKFIDFMSIDVEGPEFEILSVFPFSEYSFGLICVEHHLEHQEAQIKALMESAGYKQMFRAASGFDGFYVHPDLQTEV